MKNKNNLFFACIGTQKGGTTTLYNILKNHPELNLPDVKEAHFFDIEERYRKGIEYFFNSFFVNTENKMGIINPNIEINLKYIKRLYDQFPDIKIIYIIRNPVERAFSHYLMSKSRGYENLDFLDALSQETSRLEFPKTMYDGYKTREKGHFERNHYSYVSRGKYLEVVKYILSKNSKIILFENLVSNTDLVINEICCFLEIDSSLVLNTSIKSNQATSTSFKFINRILFKNNLSRFISSFLPSYLKNKLKLIILKINSKKIKSKELLSTETKKKVFDQYFKNDIEQLEKILNLDLSCWKY